MASSYNCEARQQAHELREQGLSLRAIATTMGKSLGMVQKYLRPAKGGVYPSDQGLSLLANRGSTTTTGQKRFVESRGIHLFPVGFLDPPPEPDPDDLYAGDLGVIAPGECKCRRFLPLASLADNSWRPTAVVPNHGRGERWCPKHGYKIRTDERELISAHSPSALHWGVLDYNVLGETRARRWRHSMVTYARRRDELSTLVSDRVDDRVLIVSTGNLAQNRRQLSDGTSGYLMMQSDTLPVLDGLDFRLLEVDEYDRPINKKVSTKSQWKLPPDTHERKYRNICGRFDYGSDYIMQRVMSHFEKKDGLRRGDKLTPKLEEEVKVYSQWLVEQDRRDRGKWQ